MHPISIPAGRKVIKSGLESIRVKSTTFDFINNVMHRILIKLMKKKLAIYRMYFSPFFKLILPLPVILAFADVLELRQCCPVTPLNMLLQIAQRGCAGADALLEGEALLAVKAEVLSAIVTHFGHSSEDEKIVTEKFVTSN